MRILLPLHLSHPPSAQEPVKHTDTQISMESSTKATEIDSIAQALNLSKQNSMEAMANNFSAKFNQHRGKSIPADEYRRVLLTGSTGAVGSFILSNLVMDDSVKDIYCVNRPASSNLVTLFDRQRSSLLDKGIPVDILSSKKVHLIQVSLHEELFGMEEYEYKKMHQSVTHIIHSAWPINFTIPLSSFEPNIRGLRNLVDFALSSPLYIPPTLIFVSTTYIFQDLSNFSERPAEAAIPSRTAIATGYTESKWVGEQVVLAAGAQAGLTTVIARIGQLCGGPNGAWKSKEWFPAMVQSGSKFVWCLPKHNGYIAWLPVHVAAKAVVDYLNISNSTILHVMHPKPVRWEALAERISSVLGVPIVPFEDWFARVEEKSSSNRKMIAGRLLRSYRNADLILRQKLNIVDAFGIPDVKVVNGVAHSPSLSMAEPLTIAEVNLWLEYWIDIGLINKFSPLAKL